jgi:hypothetical protein
MSVSMLKKQTRNPEDSGSGTLFQTKWTADYGVKKIIGHFDVSVMKQWYAALLM